MEEITEQSSKPESIEAIFVQESEFLDNFLQSLGPISNNLHLFVEEVLQCTSIDQSPFDQELEKLRELNQSANSCVAEYFEMAGKDKKLNEELRLKYEDLKKTKVIQDGQLNELQDTVKRYENILEDTRTYSAAMGSVMSSMLWKVCKAESVVDMFLKENSHLDDFLNLAHGTLLSFMDSVTQVLDSNEECEEYKYILGLCGTLANIAAHQKGRQSILELPNGLKYIHNAAHCIDNLPMPKGRALKRLILLFLYNITINKKGSYFLNSYPSSIKCVFKCAALEENGEEIVELALKILLSLVEETDKPEFLAAFREIIGIEPIDELIRTAESGNIRKLAKELREKVTVGEEQIQNRVSE